MALMLFPVFRCDVFSVFVCRHWHWRHFLFQVYSVFSVVLLSWHRHCSLCQVYSVVVFAVMAPTLFPVSGVQCFQCCFAVMAPTMFPEQSLCSGMQVRPVHAGPLLRGTAAQGPIAAHLSQHHRPAEHHAQDEGQFKWVRHFYSSQPPMQRHWVLFCPEVAVLVDWT